MIVPLIDGRYTAEDLTILLSSARTIVAKFIKADGTKRVIRCDFKPRVKYYDDRWKRWRKIKNMKRHETTSESTQYLHVFDKQKHSFRKINMDTLYYFRVNRDKYLCKPVDISEKPFDEPQVEIERLP